MKTRTIFLFVTAASIIAFLLKLLYAVGKNDDLLFMLKPIKSLTALFFNTNSIYDSSIGFYFKSLNIVIDKSCAGINFWIISFWTAISLWLMQGQDSRYKILKFIGLFLISYIFTIFANTSRIATAILALKLKKIIPLFSTPWFHQAEGVFVYLFFLLIFSLMLNYFFNKLNITHAQRA